MFKINRASGMALFKAYKSKGLITCIKGQEHNPTSFFTKNLSFTGDLSNFIVKSKFKSDGSALGKLEQYLKKNMPDSFSA